MIFNHYRYLISLMLLWRLIKEVDLLPPSINDLQIGRFLKNGKRIYIFFSKIAATKPLSGLKIRLLVFGTFKNPQIVIVYNISKQYV